MEWNGDFDAQTLAICMAYVRETMKGAGAIKGKKGDKGEKGDPGEKGDKGDDGAPGPQGVQGTTPQFEIGTTDTGEAGVTLSHNGNVYTFNFTIPKGEDGADGKSFSIRGDYATEADLLKAHPKGTDGEAYFVGSTNNPDLYVWLTDKKEWFNYGPIKGVKGDKGDKGEKGDKGDKGDDGLDGTDAAVVDLAGHIAFQYDKDDGHLYLYTEDETTADNFEYNPDDGHLYYVMQE